jgi:hypothetical protein
MKLQTQPFQQKIRKMHPKLEPTVKRELNKLLTAKIIFSASTYLMGIQLGPGNKEEWRNLALCQFT